MPTRESSLEKKIVAEVRYRGGLALKIQGLGNRGMPDRLVLLPGGRVCFLEIKRERKARDQALQDLSLRQLAGLGFVAARVWTLEQAIETMERV